MPVSRLDTRLASEGAEFLVLGQLLISGIEATKAYRNFEGFDIYAANPEVGRTCRIQVKSRWATDYDRGFPIRNFDLDFVVLVALNRGYRYTRKAAPGSGVQPPDYYVFPADVVRTAVHPSSSWGRSEKVFLNRMDNPDQYKDRWDLIRGFLKLDR